MTERWWVAECHAWAWVGLACTDAGASVHRTFRLVRLLKLRGSVPCSWLPARLSTCRVGVG